MSGSGGGGGYQYQAQATAFIATHILAKQPLHWSDCIFDLPIAVAEETDGPGDDIKITLQNGFVVEVQAKYGLEKNEKFWEAIVKLIRGLVEDSSLYGVLLTDSTASSTIRDKLREDIIRLGQGREDDLRAITQELLGRLREEGISHSSDIFRRFRIVIADLDNSQRDAKTALVLLSHILKNAEQAGQAWKVLSDDGLDLIRKRGQRDAEALFRLLGSNSLQLLPTTNLEREIDWQETCRGMLDRQIQFPTLNDLMAKDGVRIDPTLFVPVGLVERKQKQYRRSDVGSAEYGSQLLQPTEEEIVKRFDNEEDFFSQIICNSDISNHSRLVITGEPGAGKTTLLQKIGDRLCQASMFPIWLSLGKSGVLPTYEFLSRVLKENAQPRNFESSSCDASINALLQTGKVWLLLDGADEFTTDGNPLHVIGAQLREAWANQVKIVLTCRLNAWDAYALPEFKVFRTLEFDYRTPVDGYSNQVEAYIYRFFAKDGVDPQLSNTLIQQLYLSGKERIRDSVKNPLRLSLLCYIWESGMGELPDTRAELYRIFIDYYYDLQELKHPEIRIDRTERDTLNLALGEVAKAALDSHDSRFRLRKSLIETTPTMGKGNAKDSLFDKAIQLGWLNPIGTTAERPHEAAYAFLHPTFQEYFAALAIDNWDYFLPHEHIDKPIEGKEYRLFESRWKEVVLLWAGCYGREKEVESFICKLVTLNDNCGGYYFCKSYFTASAITSEFNTIYLSEIIAKLISWSFAFDGMVLPSSISIQAKRNSALLAGSRQTVITELTNRTQVGDVIPRELEPLLIQLNLRKKRNPFGSHTPCNENNGRKSTESRNETIPISDLPKLPSWNPKDLNDFWSIIGKGNVDEIVNQIDNIVTLVGLLRKRMFLAESNSKLLPLNKFIQILNNNNIIDEAALALVKVVKYSAINRIAKLASDNPVAISSLINLFHEEKDRGAKLDIIWSLGKIVPYNREATEFFLSLLGEKTEHVLGETILYLLKEITQVNLLALVISQLQQYEGSEVEEVLWHCAQNMSYPEFYRAWHSSSSANADYL